MWQRIDKRQLIWALAALLVVLVIGFALSLTGRYEDEVAEEQKVKAQRETLSDACASEATFDGLKRLVFQQARQGEIADPTNFDILAANAVVRMEDPVVIGSDEALGLTACRGNFVLELPPGAEAGFGGEHRLTASVTYEVQAAADGSGPVYRIDGTDRIASRLAVFELNGRSLPEPETDPLQNRLEPAQPLEPEPAPAPPPSDSNPSFDCADARSRSELMVCASPRLGALDRQMATLFEAAMQDADRRARRRLLRSRDYFLGYRERCPNESCIADAYRGRMLEISDIMADSD